jgi:hypothetical protein
MANNIIRIKKAEKLKVQQPENSEARNSEKKEAFHRQNSFFSN